MTKFPTQVMDSLSVEEIRFDVDEVTALVDIREFLDVLRKNDMLLEDRSSDD